MTFTQWHKLKQGSEKSNISKTINYWHNTTLSCAEDRTLLVKISHLSVQFLYSDAIFFFG